ncbi:MAG: excinuclease ABC subunit UvrB [Patescibacteria group bacterium]|nr:excinuclease ABC subunit UvrB [Patescibacteria group bacterium]
MSTQKFKLHSTYQPTGDQPQAIEKLSAGVEEGMEHQVLLGLTGSGKTFTMANVIEEVQKPTLIISHNKTLAAQLYQEFREFFPENSVNYFVSYYDYYQPEAYVPQRDLYIEKEAEINEEIEKLRHSVTQALMSRKDVIVVASVSCIYGLGRPQDYAEGNFKFQISNTKREKALRGLIRLLYKRNDWDFKRGCFRVRGDTIEVYPPYGERVLRLGFLGQKLSEIKWLEPQTSRTLESLEEITLYPAEHFITPEKRLKKSIELIQSELEQQVKKLKDEGKDLEAQRLKQRTNYDLELMEELGFCPGIENYSRYLSGREEGEAPYTLLDYFTRNTMALGKDMWSADSDLAHSPAPRAAVKEAPGASPAPGTWLCIIDESHMTIPQIRGMYNGDRARKETLVEHGFRLPSALDNRPLKFNEFQEKVQQTIYTSATPSQWEIRQAQEAANNQSPAPGAAAKEAPGASPATHNKTHSGVVEQLIRPTGLLDPEIEVRSTKNQIEDLVREIIKCKKKGERVLVTTLTKRMAEDLADYLNDPDRVQELLVEEPHSPAPGAAAKEAPGASPAAPIKTHYLHSEVETLERSDILVDLRRGKYDVVVGINLLREGLDLPEVSLVAILDADKEGFLRSDTSLIQTMGRAARHEKGKAILYADKITGSMNRAIEEIERRRNVQKEYNEKHNITPETIQKPIRDRVIARLKDGEGDAESDAWREMPPHELEGKIWEWEKEMREAADELNFEKAAELRDKIREAQRNL